MFSEEGYLRIGTSFFSSSEAFVTISSSAAEALSLDAQEAEENFDRSLIFSIENDVVPHLGDARVPDAMVSQLAKVLAQGSRLYDSSPHDSPSSTHSSSPVPLSHLSSELQEFVKVDVDYHYRHGSTEQGALLPREQFSYWCFDTLFHICSNAMKGKYLITLPVSADSAIQSRSTVGDALRC